jgi:hypothetical protein
VNLTLAAPLLIGMFWGAPLIAREIDQSTHKLIWTQTVTRRQWLTAKVTWAVMVAVLWGAALAALVTWWSGPENAIDYSRFYPGQFDLQGLVPAAYCLFAVALGITAGTLASPHHPLGRSDLHCLRRRPAAAHRIRPAAPHPPVSEAVPVGGHLSQLKQNVWTLSLDPPVK